MDGLADAGVGREMGVISATSVAYRNAPTREIEQTAAPVKMQTSGFYKSIKSRQGVWLYTFVNLLQLTNYTNK